METVTDEVIGTRKTVEELARLAFLHLTPEGRIEKSGSEGDVLARAREFATRWDCEELELQRIPLHQCDFCWCNWSHAVATQYKERFQGGSMYPPIMATFAEDIYHVEDGNHRCKALSWSGETDVLAWVPV
jgi:hypothetical protein